MLLNALFSKNFLLKVVRYKFGVTCFLEDNCSITKSSEFFQNRSDFQCQHRWQKVLNPELIKGPWTKEEDQRVTCSYSLFSLCRWTCFFSSSYIGFLSHKYMFKSLWFVLWVTAGIRIETWVSWNVVFSELSQTKYNIYSLCCLKVWFAEGKILSA